jgi:hypothetical protein
MGGGENDGSAAARAQEKRRAEVRACRWEGRSYARTGVGGGARGIGRGASRAIVHQLPFVIYTEEEDDLLQNHIFFLFINMKNRL